MPDPRLFAVASPRRAEGTQPTGLIFPPLPTAFGLKALGAPYCVVWRHPRKRVWQLLAHARQGEATSNIAVVPILTALQRRGHGGCHGSVAHGSMLSAFIAYQRKPSLTRGIRWTRWPLPFPLLCGLKVVDLPLRVHVSGARCTPSAHVTRATFLVIWARRLVPCGSVRRSPLEWSMMLNGSGGFMLRGPPSIPVARG